MRRSSIPLVTIAVIALTAGIVLLRLQHHAVSVGEARQAGAVGCRDVARAYRTYADSVWLTLSAPVSSLLPDEYGNFQHQRFIVRCPSGQTVLIVNDVSVGQRVPVKRGDVVVVHGQYVWNQQGGLVHYTHHSGGGQSGWIFLAGKIYS